MKKIIASLVVVAWLMAPAAGFSQDKGKKSSTATGSKEQMMMGMMGMWWNMGAVSQGMSQMLEEAAGFLERGNLSSDSQKKLGDVLKQMSKMVTEMYKPQEPSKQKDYIDNLKKLKDQLDDVASSAQTQPGQSKPAQQKPSGK